MTSELAVAIVLAAIVSATSIVLPALGELLAERSGVLNLGVEGMMLMGALFGFVVHIQGGSLWLAFPAAALAAAALALVHAVATISLGATQIESGLATTLLGSGFTAFVGRPYVGLVAPAPLQRLDVLGLAGTPLLGPIVFGQDVITYGTLALVPLLIYGIWRTRPGLHLRAIGESPATADAMGIGVPGRRYLYVLLGGALAGLGGAYLSLSYTPTWIEGMTAGRGWIAIGLVAFGLWQPGRVLLGAALFGVVDGLQLRAQALGSPVPSFFMNMLPYLFTIVAVGMASSQRVQKRFGAPAALGEPYWREDRL